MSRTLTQHRLTIELKLPANSLGGTATTRISRKSNRKTSRTTIAYDKDSLNHAKMVAKKKKKAKILMMMRNCQLRTIGSANNKMRF